MFHFRVLVLQQEKVDFDEYWNHCGMKFYIYILKYAIFRILIYLKLWKIKVCRVLLESWRNQLRLFVVTVITKKTLAFRKTTRPLSSLHLTSQGEVVSGADSRTFYWMTVLVDTACIGGASAHLGIFFFFFFFLTALHYIVWKLWKCWSIPMSPCLWFPSPIWLSRSYFSSETGDMYFRQALNRSEKYKICFAFRMMILTWSIHHLSQNDLLAKRQISGPTLELWNHSIWW